MWEKNCQMNIRYTVDKKSCIKYKAYQCELFHKQDADKMQYTLVGKYRVCTKWIYIYRCEGICTITKSISMRTVS